MVSELENNILSGLLLVIAVLMAFLGLRNSLFGLILISNAANLTIFTAGRLLTGSPPLIDAGADVNAKTELTGETLLNSAAWGAAQGAPKSYENYLDLTKLLISKGADVNVKLKSGSMIQDDEPYRDKSRDTILHQVARSYSEQHASEVCELLIANGAKVNEVNVKGQTPLDEALANGRKKTAEFLRKYDAKTSEELKAEGK